MSDHSNGPLAHSPPEPGLPGDTYTRHVQAVKKGAVERAEKMLRYAQHAPQGLLKAIETAAAFHDLGKLDSDNQKTLRKGRGARLKWDHIDAGVAHLSALDNWMAAWIVRAHHAPGLPQKAAHFDPDRLGRRLRGRRVDDENGQRHSDQMLRTDSRLMGEYLPEHAKVLGEHAVEKCKPVHGLTMRLALSCLVDADHEDTAFFDTKQLPSAVPEPRWSERLDALCAFVRGLPEGKEAAERTRNKRRSDFFNACLDSSITDRILACEGPVGLGKTTAITAYLLRRAIDEGLRRLIIVAPFTNILSQTADRLRKALVLPGEQCDHVVVEHHHRADFSHRSDRELAALWRAPVVLTTAVGFFETLAASDPATLRKLHELPGSAIFLDEAHAALPTKLWPQNWKWIRELAGSWQCCLVLVSGSLCRFWEDKDILEDAVTLPELLPPQLADHVMEDERCRVRFTQAGNGEVLAVRELIDLIRREPGPRLVILNTVQNAAVVAKAMRDSGADVLHLSTALTPFDRETILKRTCRRLHFRNCRDWTLVATSCVEAGVDFSFRCAFRERFAAASTIQVGGRVNRNGEYTPFGGGVVYDFALEDKGITQHPAASVTADVLRDLLVANALNDSSPADVVTQAMREELRRRGGPSADPLAKAEAERDYPTVSKLGRIIDADTRFVVIDPHLKKLLKDHQPVDFRALLLGSVQLWSAKIDKLGLEPLPGRRDIYVWNDGYDPDFLGYMNGVLRNEEFMRSNEAWVL